MCNYKRRDFAVVVTVCWVFMVNVLTVDAEVCNGHIDIRNDPAKFTLLENCTVVAGSVQIVLMERHRYVNFSMYQFPELR